MNFDLNELAEAFCKAMANGWWGDHEEGEVVPGAPNCRFTSFKFKGFRVVDCWRVTRGRRSPGRVAILFGGKIVWQMDYWEAYPDDPVVMDAVKRGVRSLCSKGIFSARGPKVLAFGDARYKGKHQRSSHVLVYQNLYRGSIRRFCGAEEIRNGDSLVGTTQYRGGLTEVGLPLPIGLIGPIGAGKEAFWKILREILSPLTTIDRFSTSNLLGGVLDILGIPRERSDLQRVALALDRHYCKGVVSRAVAKNMLDSGKKVVVFDSIRWPTDMKAVRDRSVFPQSLVVRLRADQRTRWERVQTRKEKRGENGISFAAFQRSERVGTETSIARLARQADVVIDNDGTFDDLRSRVEQFVKDHIEPKL